MKKDTLLEDKINRYIGGHMTQDEKVSFEKLLSEDDTLNERVQNEALIKINIKKYHNKKIKEQLKVIHDKTVNKKSRFKYFILFALVALLSILGFYYLSQNNTIEVSNQEIYAQYYEKYEIKSDQRSNETGKVDETFNYYKDGDYEKVIKETDESLLKNLPASNRLVIGVSLLEINNLERAKLVFQSIIDDKDIVFTDQAMWYKALAELKDNNEENTIILLNQILKDKNSDHFEDAQKLLENLK